MHFTLSILLICQPLAMFSPIRYSIYMVLVSVSRLTYTAGLFHTLSVLQLICFVFNITWAHVPNAFFCQTDFFVISLCATESQSYKVLSIVFCCWVYQKKRKRQQFGLDLNCLNLAYTSTRMLFNAASKTTRKYQTHNNSNDFTALMKMLTPFDLIVNLQFICAMCMCARVWVYCVCVCLNLMFALCSLFKSHHFFPTWLSRCKVWSRCFHLVLFYFPLTGAKSRCRRNCGPTAIEVFYRMNQRSINPCGSTILFVLIYAFDIFNMRFSTQFLHSFFVSFGYCNWGKAWCQFQSCFPCTWN